MQHIEILKGRESYMIALSTQDVRLSFHAQDVLKDVSFSVNDGDRVGIIGVNGAGKTSLFKVISGQYAADGGAVYIQKGHTVGMLEQNPDLSALPKNLTCLEYMYTAFESLLSAERQMEEYEKQIAAASREGKNDIATAVSLSLAELSRDYSRNGGLEFRSRCRSMLLRLAFDEDTLNRRISTLSGGQYTRLALARLLATEPDILMLDEPTNHLDIDSLLWLESFLSSYKKTVLIISHDRFFLDKTTNKTLHILYGGARLYNGNYSFSKSQMESEAASLEKRYKEQQKEIAKIRANIEFQRRCNREHNFVTIRSKEKQLARMEKIELAPKAPKDIRLSFSSESESAGDVILFEGVGFGYGDNNLIENLTLIIRRYERVMFLGPNGSGKSTLMKLINSILPVKSGKITLGYNIKIAYYDQENRELNASNTVFSEMREEYPLKTDLELRSTLALFLFGAEDMDKSVGALSGGERARLTLAKLILKKVNLLIMDEPTNHLDIGSCEALETALLNFDGTIVAVSHDRYFINKIATRIVHLDKSRPNGMVDITLAEQDDAFESYLALRERVGGAKRDSAASEQKNATSREEYEKKKREQAEIRAKERQIQKARERISLLEERLSSLDAELFTSASTNYQRAMEIENEKAEIEEELLALYELTM